MTDFIDIVEHNPITFVKAVVEKLKEGYVVHNDIEGFPHFGAYSNGVRLYKGEKRTGVTMPEGFTGIVQHYEPMHLLLLIEDAVLAGYSFKEDGQHFIDERSLKTIELTKEEEKPKAVKKVSAKKELKAEETKEELEGK